jgi:protein-tyrosine phosphatase
MAEGIMRYKIEKLHLDASTNSCGTANYHVGDSPDIRGQQTLFKHGIDISHHRSRQFSIRDFDHFDMIFAMDENNYQDILFLARDQSDEQKVQLIMDMVYPGENIPVPDPYYGSLINFEETYQLLDLACEKIATKLCK